MDIEFSTSADADIQLLHPHNVKVENVTEIYTSFFFRFKNILNLFGFLNLFYTLFTHTLFFTFF